MMIIKKFILFFFISFRLYALESVTIASGDWEPFIYHNDRTKGLMTLICTKAFESQNVKVNYEWMPWVRGFELTKKGVYDISIGWDYTKERAKDFYYTKPFFILNTVIFHLKSNFIKWDSFNDLKKYRFGGVKGYNYGKDITKAIKNNSISMEYSKNEETVLKKLIAKRIDIFIAEKEVGLHILKKYFSEEDFKKVTFHPKIYNSNNYHLLVSKQIHNGKKIVETFNKGLESINKK